jgi:hypothetical protein
VNHSGGGRGVCGSDPDLSERVVGDLKLLQHRIKSAFRHTPCP